MHTDPRLVHRVADQRREALLSESAASARGQSYRVRTTPAPGPLRSLLARVGSGIGWLLTEFEARPAVAQVPDATPSLGHLTSVGRRAPIRTA
jgi:hypothetical protein